jgi:hypothetical protein
MKVAQLAERVQRLFGKQADQLAREHGFVRRQSKTSGLTGASFLRALVQAVMSEPACRDSSLAQSAASVGIDISAQGFVKRLEERCAAYLKAVLEQAVGEIVNSKVDTTGLLRRFSGVYLYDSTVLSLPIALAELYRGCGGSRGMTAAMKVQVAYELCGGGLTYSCKRAKPKTAAAAFTSSNYRQAR